MFFKSDKTSGILFFDTEIVCSTRFVVAKLNKGVKRIPLTRNFQVCYDIFVFDWLQKRKQSKSKEPLKAPLLSSKDQARQKYAHLYVGEVIHYYANLQVGIIRIDRGKIAVGDTLFFQGKTTRFKQKVTSIEYNHQKVREAGVGYEIGIRLGARVRETDDVYCIK